MTLGRGVLLVVAAVHVLACASSAPTPAAPTGDANAPSSAVSRYLPLADGRIWAYDEEDEETKTGGVFVTRARKLVGTRFSLTTGQRTRIVEMRADGIATENGVYLLKLPLVAGTQWPGERGSLVRIAGADKVVQVPAGTFAGCVETVEDLAAPTGGENPLRRITTQFCPDVGIASLRVEVWEQGKHSGERAVLRCFGEPVTLVK
jgi:hypothetical protein